MATRILLLLSLLTSLSAHASGLGPQALAVEQVSVRIHWVETTREIIEVAKKIGHPAGSGNTAPLGFSILGDDGNGNYICHIWAVQPKSWKDNLRLATVGHEMAHCIGYAH